MKRRIVSGIMLTLLLIGMLSMAFHVVPVFAEDPMKVGVIGPMTWIQGAGMREGATLAVEEINAAGGVLGRNLTLRIGDEGSTPETGEAEMLRLCSEEKAQFILGGFRTEIVDSMREIACAYRTPFIMCGSATPWLLSCVTTGVGDHSYPCGRCVTCDYEHYKYLFRVAPTNTDVIFANYLVPYMREYLIPEVLFPGLGMEVGKDKIKVACIVEELAWTEVLRNKLDTIGELFFGPALTEVLKVGDHYYWGVTPFTKDFSTILADIKDRGAHVIFEVFSGEEGLAFIKQWKDLKIPAVPIGVNMLSQDSNMWEWTDGKCEYETIIGCMGTRNPITPLSVPFWDAYIERWGHAPIYTAFGAYEAMYIIAEACEQAALPLDYPELTDPTTWKTLYENRTLYDILIPYIEKVDRIGVLGRFKFTRFHDVFSGGWRAEDYGLEDYVKPLVLQWREAAESGRLAVVSDGKREITAPPPYVEDFQIPPWMIPGHPIAEFTYSPPYPFANQTVTFNASASFDPDSAIVSYAWDFGDGATDAGVVVTHTYTAAGIYNVTLTVTDNDGLADSTTADVTVSEVAPRARWVVYSEFTGLDHTIWWEEKEGRYADNVSDARNEWTKVGTNPYVDEIDNPTNYIKATADSQEIGDFTFSTSPDGAIKEVYIELYCNQKYNEQIKVWYSVDGGTHWTNSGTLKPPRATWEWRHTGDESANIDTWAKVNNLLVYLESVAKDVWYDLPDATAEVDCMRLRIIKSEACYAPPNLWNLTWSKPDYWPEINTEWINMTIQELSGTERSLLLTTHFKNGSEKDKTLNGDVATGLGDLGFFFIEPNLEEGDEIMWDHTKVMGAQTSAIKLYINGTVSREYAGVNREVNYVDVVIPATSVPATYVSLTAFWDKSTGVLCEISMAAAHGPISILRDRIDAWTSFKMTHTSARRACEVTFLTDPVGADFNITFEGQTYHDGDIGTFPNGTSDVATTSCPAGWRFHSWETADNVSVTDSTVTITCGGILKAVFVEKDLVPTIESCDPTGAKKDIFDLDETVYVNGSDYAPRLYIYDIYVVNDTTWNDDKPIPERVPGTLTTVSSNSFGKIDPTAVWSDLTVGKYDIVVDVNGNGVYDEGVDALDDIDIQETAGFLVIPEYALGAVLGLIACFAAFGVFLKSKRMHRVKTP